ncbi:MAG TPA: GtrA family protein [Terriglobales bacterium]|nr:GtrA family protein [Terriglobales bacterium]
MNRISDRIPWRRWLKFNLVGAIGILVQLAALAILKGVAGVPYLVATALAVECAVVHNFVWHERFTWADRPSLDVSHAIQRFVRFSLTNGMLSILANLLIMRILAGQLRLNYLAANVISIAGCSVLNFLASDWLVFRGSPCSDSATQEKWQPDC